MLKCLVLLFVSLSVHAGTLESVNAAKIKALEKRVLFLEQALKTKKTSMNLNVKDLNNNTIDSSMKSPEISPEKQKELMKTLEGFKKKRERQMKMLEEIDKEI